MTRLKVQIVCGGGIVSGKEVVALSLARGLRALGWNVEFLTSVWEGAGEFRKQLEAEDFDFHRLRFGFISATLRWEPVRMTLHQLCYWPAMVVRYRSVVSANAPDAVIHTNWHHVLLLLPLLGPQDIYWVHEIYPLETRFKKLFRMFAKRLGLFVCVSHAVAKNLQALGVPRSMIIVVHNGTSVPASVTSRNQSGKLRLGIVGQVNPEKGHGDVLDAMVLLCKRGIHVQLLVFGNDDSVYAMDLKRRIGELGITSAVEWRGFVRDQCEIYGDIDVCVVPSHCHEAFGMSAAEAGGFGRPVICSSLGGLPEVVKDGETGLLIDPCRPDLLASAIQRFDSDRELIARMGKAAEKHIRAEFSHEMFVRRFAAALETLRRPSHGRVAVPA